MPRTIQSSESMKRTAPRKSELLEREEQDLTRSFVAPKGVKSIKKEATKPRKSYGYQAALEVVQNHGGETVDHDLFMRSAFGDNPRAGQEWELSRTTEILDGVKAKADDQDLPFVYIPSNDFPEELTAGIIPSPSVEGEFLPSHKMRVVMDMVRSGWTSSLIVNALEIIPAEYHPNLLTLSRQATEVEIPLVKTVETHDSSSTVGARLFKGSELYLGYTAISRYFGYEHEVDDRVLWLMSYTQHNVDAFDPARNYEA